LTAARTYPTTIEDLWDALTSIERIPRWFLPITGELRPGGRYQLEGNAAGEILECDPPHRFEITWEYGGDTSWVTVELSGDRGKDEARLQLRHLAHVPDDLWDQYGPGSVGIGWDLGLMGLELHLSSGDTFDPEQMRGWESSPDGRAFITQSSSAWAEASIARGADPRVAWASAERVTSIYTTGDE
jgi:uncharacterized protein YndB with AHSA1/START domain